MSKSKIDWCDITINPFTGCRHGCSFCYARKMAKRQIHLPGGEKYRQVDQARGDPFWPAYHQTALWDMEHVLERARKPRRVFIGSMGDMCFRGSMFCPETFNHYEKEIYTEELQKTIAIFCTGLPRHTFQILTKRPDLLSHEVEWPSNVHLGVSVSRSADHERLAMLGNKRVYATEGGWWDPQMLIWASVEPLLDKDFNPRLLSYVDWVVVGAETGNRKGVDGSIIRSAQRIVNWCSLKDIPVFVKDNMRRADVGYYWPREFPG